MELGTDTQIAGRELIAFRVSGQEFCVDIMAVREIRGWMPATALPRAPRYVCGVINLRGAVLPIIDLAARLGFEATTPSARHVIIVARIGQKIVGLLVDGVSDILTVAESTVQPAPAIAADPVRGFVRGLLPLDGRMIALLALDLVLPDACAEAA